MQYQGLFDILQVTAVVNPILKEKQLVYIRHCETVRLK